ncbi:MAG: polysaccharide biosynthesis protein [Acidobacteriota bacterium]|nr:MAG: polysaccharide biosynthesis protein [Acidobacteriota bacterium]
MVRRRFQNAWLVVAKLLIDGLLVATALVISYLFRFGLDLPGEHATLLARVLPPAVLLKLVLFWAFGNYATLWRYSSVNDLLRLTRSVVASSLALVALLYFLTLRIPASIVLLDGLLTMAFCGTVRLMPRLARERANPTLLAALPDAFLDVMTPRRRGAERHILIVGAGDAGESLVREMRRNDRIGYLPVGFVDDDPNKKGMRIHGVKVRGNREDIPRLVAQYDVDEILIAIPSATADQIRPIVDICRWTGVKLKMLPDLASLVHGSPRLADVRELRIEDLLGRPRIELNTDEVSAYLQGRRVLITGAGGSIGAELCRQVLRYAPSELLLFGRGENSIFAIFHELAPRRGATSLVEIIGDVINKRKLAGVFERFRPEIVFHAGADKHVPLMELNPDEAVLNNILGTRNVIDVSEESGVERLVCISTDKAVNPTSIMGCCKRVAELYVQAAASNNTRVTAVRFGNVLGSRGSVIPLFQQQIERGGPVTVTHREVRRYFMTIPEAVALVIQAGAIAQGGDIFVLDMGEPIKIDELARRVIRLHGLEPDKDIPMMYVGLRPGEKLDEELIGTDETRERTNHAKIFRVRGRAVRAADLEELVGQLVREAVEMNELAIRRTLKLLVPEYEPYLPPDVQSWVAKRST